MHNFVVWSQFVSLMSLNGWLLLWWPSYIYFCHARLYLLVTCAESWRSVRRPVCQSLASLKTWVALCVLIAQ